MSDAHPVASNASTSRRDFLKSTTTAAAAATVLAQGVPAVHAGENNTIHLALVGCGGRGTGAAANAMSVKNGPTKLVAMADVFEDKLGNSYRHLSQRFADQMDVPEDRRFIGFDAYRKAMDCLNPGDVVLLTTPPAFRWVHFTYAIEKGLNVFMEKPVAVDGPSARKMFELGKRAAEQNLKVGVGLMCRHCEARGELYERIRNGELGEILLLRAYRMAGPTGSAFTEKKPDNMSELLYQIRRFHAFLWASGGAFSDFLIHNIDECCWMKDAWPVRAKACGGRHYRNNYVDQNFDSYSVEYTFEDGTKLTLNGRCMPGCYNEFASYAHGTKGAAVISTSAHYPAKSRIYSSQDFHKSSLVWKFGRKEITPYQLEWDHLIDAIRNDVKGYNEVERGTQASLVTAMGRMAAHTGQVVTYEQMLQCEHEFAPQVAELTMDGPAPLTAGPDGTYPVPAPGIKTDREY
ncbi:MAG TPA: Gfo/Idh/MocA family oxidoreductase [Planctomycetaceae bacterium]|nr:Gfo/Idh/MocA family oxidoreductase [Planctomycetaceae bacterium]